MNNLFAQYSDYNYTTDSSSVDGAAGVFLVGFMALFVLFSIVISYVVSAFLLGRIFQKAGVEQWKAWVPIYNIWTLMELGGQAGFWSILLLVPVVQIVAMVFLFMAMHQIGLKLQKSGAFVLLAIFLPLVWMIWLAFDDSKWKGKKVTPASKTATKE